MTAFVSPRATAVSLSLAQAAQEAQVNGRLAIAAWTGDRWQPLGELPFRQSIGAQSLTVPAGLLPLDQPARLQITPLQTNASHLDLASLGGQPPQTVAGSLETADLALKKLGDRDHDLIDAARPLELSFAAPRTPEALTLNLSARIEPAEISQDPFQFPTSNVYKDVSQDPSAAFYLYPLGSRPGRLAVNGDLNDESLGTPFFREFSIPGTGHPPGETRGWVRNDAETLYVAIDFASDNTLDGSKDYAKVFAKTPSGVKEFKLSVPEQTWGKPGFVYGPTVPYQHKVYEFAIPLRELGNIDSVPLAFATYGTAALPGSTALSINGAATGTLVQGSTKQTIAITENTGVSGGLTSIATVLVPNAAATNATQADFVQFQVFKSSDAVLDTGDIQLASFTGASTNGGRILAGNTAIPLTVSTLATGEFLFLTADISPTAAVGQTISVTIDPNNAGLVNSTNYTKFSIVAAPVVPTPPSGTSGPQPQPSILGFAGPGGAASPEIPDGIPEYQAIGNTQAGVPLLRFFSLSNPGGAPLLLTDFTLPPGFSFLTPPPREIAPGGAALLQIQLDGLVPGDYRGNLVVKTNTPDVPFYNFPIQGSVAFPPAPTFEQAVQSVNSPPFLLGAAGLNTFLGGPGSQVIVGFEGDDLLYGNEAPDVLAGNQGNDALFGGKGNDVLFGGKGDDWLAGDLGDDSLLGDQGSDRFVLGSNTGVDTVYDYLDGTDKFLLLSPLTFADLSFAKTEDGTQILAGGKVLAKVLGAVPSLLEASDFVFP